MKPKLLFIIGTMDSGGISKSMISLLNTMDKDKYEIDLFILYPFGLCMDLIPDKINILTNEKLSLILAPFPQCILLPLKKGHLITAFLRLMIAFISRINHGYSAWILSKLVPINDTKYDTVIDYNGQYLLYYMVDKVVAEKKISFFHFDYSKWNHYHSIDKKYYPKVNYIFNVSESCADSMKKYFPECVDKIKIMENISSVKLLYEMSENNITDFDLEIPSILTIGHINTQKGSDLAINAAAILKKNDVKFKWYFIGSCKEINRYNDLKKKLDVEDEIIFLGLRSNPYPYIKLSTIFCLPSQFEGKSIALDEAKILCKPIVVTNFSTVYDQFEDKTNATICEMNPIDLADALSELLSNKYLREEYINYLKINLKDNSSEIENLYNALRD